MEVEGFANWRCHTYCSYRPRPRWSRDPGLVGCVALRSLYRLRLLYIAMTFLRRVVSLSSSRKFGWYPEAGLANCAFEAIQASLALLVLVSLVHPSRAFAANSNLETVLT